MENPLSHRFINPRITSHSSEFSETMQMFVFVTDVDLGNLFCGQVTKTFCGLSNERSI